MVLLLITAEYRFKLVLFKFCLTKIWSIHDFVSVVTLVNAFIYDLKPKDIRVAKYLFAISNPGLKMLIFMSPKKIVKFSDLSLLKKISRSFTKFVSEVEGDLYVVTTLKDILIILKRISDKVE